MAMAVPVNEVGARPFLSPRNPIWSLTLAFALWKTLVFLVVAACPGPGYDTSTSLLPYQVPAPATDSASASSLTHHLRTLPLKFVRWDAIYFVHIIEHGYVFEQEWAFGWGYTRLLNVLTSVFSSSGQIGGVVHIAWVAMGLSHLSHYLSVLALYRLSGNVFGLQTPTQRLVCFLSAMLHIITPAGAFLSAPYMEPLFSFLNISGLYFYSSSLLDDYSGKRLSRDCKLLSAALLFGVATTVRSNGILSGFLFAYDAVWQFQRVVVHGLSVDAVVRLGAIVLGGCIVGLGMVLPQIVAYSTYCMDDNITRPWCQWTIPSIYGWVQEQYWNVGFLRYWTVSNIPLFLLAAPMLITLLYSSVWALRMPWTTDKDRPLTPTDHTMSPAVTDSLLIRLAVPQGLLAVMAFTSYHVQIVNRISSGYPLWYWYLVCLVVSRVTKPPAKAQPTRLFAIAVQGMVIYGLIQAVLFGSFLPPA